MAMDKKINEMAASLGELELGTASSEPKASMELHSTFRKTPGEAWVITKGGKFEIYARRVVQFAIICSTGCRFKDTLAYLQGAPLQHVLEKYKSIAISLGWHTMFLPGFVLDLLCRRERGHELEDVIHEKCISAEAIIKEQCKLINRPDQGTIDYEELRQEWTTVFSTNASGAESGTQTSGGCSPTYASPFTAGTLIRTLIGYPQIELVEPEDDTLNALIKSVRGWHSERRSNRQVVDDGTVHIFWNLGQFWTINDDHENVLDYPKDDRELDDFETLLREVNLDNYKIFITIFSGVSHVVDYVPEETMASWERAMSKFVEIGESCGIMVDRGNGFWLEHQEFWDEEKYWFRITQNSVRIAKLVDRYILRQKVLLKLKIDLIPGQELAGLDLLHHKMMSLAHVAWPLDERDDQEVMDFIYDPDDEEDASEQDVAVGAPNKSIDQFGTAEHIRASYEISGEGQQRHWVRNESPICCETTTTRWTKVQTCACEKPDRCT